MGSDVREGLVCSTIHESRTFSRAASSLAVKNSIWEKSCIFSARTAGIADTNDLDLLAFHHRRGNAGEALQLSWEARLIRPSRTYLVSAPTLNPRAASGQSAHCHLLRLDE